MLQQIYELRRDVCDIMWRKIYHKIYNEIVKIREIANFPLDFSSISNLESLINED